MKNLRDKIIHNEEYHPNEVSGVPTRRRRKEKIREIRMPTTI